MDKEREAFEKWIEGAECVSDYIRQAYWAGWKARAALDMSEELASIDEKYCCVDPFDLESPPDYKELVDYCREMREALNKYRERKI